MKPGCPIYCLFTMILTLDECIHSVEAFTLYICLLTLAGCVISMRFTFYSVYSVSPFCIVLQILHMSHFGPSLETESKM